MSNRKKEVRSSWEKVKRNFFFVFIMIKCMKCYRSMCYSNMLKTENRLLSLVYVSSLSTAFIFLKFLIVGLVVVVEFEYGFCYVVNIINQEKR